MFATSQGLWKMRIWNLLHENVRCDLPFPRLHVWMKLWWSPPWCKWRDLEDSSNIKNKEQRNELKGQILRSRLYCWQYLVNTFSHNDVIKNKLTFFITLKHLRVSIPTYKSSKTFSDSLSWLLKPYQKRRIYTTEFVLQEPINQTNRRITHLTSLVRAKARVFVLGYFNQ